MGSTFYTIGCSNRNEFDFISILLKYGIEIIIDVRSVPYSKYTYQYNRENLELLLLKNGIDYVYFGNTLGARIADKSLYTDNIVDFSLVSRSPQFMNSLANVLKYDDKRICIMCTEKNPEDCHRAILISPNIEILFPDSVIHIIDEENVCMHKELEKKLVNEYFPDRHQLSFFVEQKSEEYYIAEMYKIQNRKIGYKQQCDLTIW